jgi:hypothetical protein
MVYNFAGGRENYLFLPVTKNFIEWRPFSLHFMSSISSLWPCALDPILRQMIPVPPSYPVYFTYTPSISVFQCFIRYWFSVAFRHSCRFTASSGVKFFYFITLSTSLSHFISGLPCLCLLPSGDQVIRLGHLLSPKRNTFPYHFNVSLILSSHLCLGLLRVSSV